MSTALNEQKKIAAALKALDRHKISQAFDPYRPNSRPNSVQEEVLKDIGKVQYRYVVAANQCLAADTYVATPRGPQKIQELCEGDEVLNEFGKPVRVLAKVHAGLQPVCSLFSGRTRLGAATAHHKFQLASNELAECQELTNPKEVIRQFVPIEPGTERVDRAYVIGAMLGDGGCTFRSNTRLQITTPDTEIVHKVAGLLQGTFNGGPLQWYIHMDGVNSQYEAWCRGRYAHSKYVDIEQVRNWDLWSIKELLAGMLDTDGSVYPDRTNEGRILLSFCSQAKSLAEFVQWAILLLTGHETTIVIDKRTKYGADGCVYQVGIKNSMTVRQLMWQLRDHSVVLRKSYRYYWTEAPPAQRETRGKLRWDKQTERVVDTWDLSIDSATNLYMLANGLVNHNSGKSQTVAREIAWVLNGNHPYWTRPAEWGDEPLLVLIIGQDLTMIATELWGKKIAPFMDLSEWRQEKQGNTLKRVVNKRTGDQIIFLSHSDGSDKNRKHMQGYVAHYVWLDEMPSSTAILEESQLRVQSKGGIWISAFTPKFRNDKIRKIVDGSTQPYAKKYRFSKFDNPIFADAYESEMQRLAGYSESERNTILYGEWSTGDNAVYHFDYDKMTVAELPQHYSQGWRHAVVVDPALVTKCGYTLWAEDPLTGVWLLIQDDYIMGSTTMDPEALYQHVMAKSHGFNIVLRGSDTMAFFLSVAAKHGTPFKAPYSKTTRKPELIKGLQRALSSGKIKIGAWCGTFIDEIQSCRFRDDSSEVMVNSSSYHTLDSAQYFIDLMPPWVPNQQSLPADQYLRQQDLIRLKQLKMNNNKPRTRAKAPNQWRRRQAGKQNFRILG